ncbi:hypothetical protein D7X33_22125 [Butyricicoccus sp. 1XD8-22]|nr:hypothetical protein D7X33_22125 [Butyricicoccus sp. 1XD8-22]
MISRERKILLRTAETHRAGLWVLLLYTELRPGESAALNCSDICDGFIRVDKALDNRTNELKPPKSCAGVRSIPIPGPLAKRPPSLPPESGNCPLFTQFDRTREHRPRSTATQSKA